MMFMQMEFDEAKKELQAEIMKGHSIDEIRKKIISGEIQTKVSKQLKSKKYFRTERIQRKKRDPMHILNKHKAKSLEATPLVERKALTQLELYAKAMAERDGIPVVSKKQYKISDKELLVGKMFFFFHPFKMHLEPM